MEKYEPLKQIKNIKTGYPEKTMQTCKVCEKKFIQSRITQVYCSYECSPKSKKTYKDKNCIICDSKFTPINIGSKCCSFTCKAKYQLEKRSNKPKTKNCAFCSNEFTPYTSLDKYCSATCRTNNKKSKSKRNWTKEQVAKRYGKNNPAYRNGLYTEVNTKTQEGLKFFHRNRNEIKEKMIDDLGYIYCEHCKTSNSLRFESHHIVFRSEKPNHEHLHDKANILHVCIKCHNEFHKHKGLRNDIVVERKLNELFGDDILNKN